MKRLPGIVKIITGLTIDFIVIYLSLNSLSAACIITSLVAVYVWLGGYIALLKEGAISHKKAPAYQADRLDAARNQLISDVNSVSDINLSHLKLFIIPGDNGMNATAYGANCVSVTRGILDNVDSITLTAVLGHEASHLIHLDPELNRLVFASVTLITASLSIISAAVAVVIFLAFLILNCFSSYLGVLAFKGTTKVSKGIFGLIQRCVVMIYRVILGLTSRHAEYRCDRYSFSLGYGIQLAHFLSMADRTEVKALTLTDAIYRSHPPTYRRIARLEQQLNTQKNKVMKIS